MIKFQAWQFDENPDSQDLFSKRSKDICDKSLTFSGCRMSRLPHFVHSDLVGSGFLKA